MKKRVSVCIRRLAGGNVSVEVVDEEGKVIQGKQFGKFSEEEYELLLKAIDIEGLARGASPTTIRPSDN
jgi:hypothetical protein